jgi:hypothetical protein
VLLDHGAVAVGHGPTAAWNPRRAADGPALAWRSPRPAWLVGYRAALLGLDALVAAIAAATLLLADPGAVRPPAAAAWALWCLVPAWPGLLAALDAYTERVFGTGSEEYRRVARSGLLLLAAAGFVSYFAGLDLPRAIVVVAIPALTIGTLLVRYSARKVLVALRTRGRCTKRVVVVGRGGAVLELMRRLERAGYAGLDVIAACVPPADRASVGRQAAVPVAGLDDVLDMAHRHGADTVAVTSASETAAEYLRRLSWQLEGTGLELLVAPGLVEVAGPRLHIRPFEGLPLLAVEAPQFAGWRRLVKGESTASSPPPCSCSRRCSCSSPWPCGCRARGLCSTGRNASACTAGPSAW